VAGSARASIANSIVRLMNAFVVALMVLAQPAYGQRRMQVDIPLRDGRNLTGVLYASESPNPAPAVIVLHTAFGAVESFDEQYAQALAKEGFVALAPNYIHPSFGTRFWTPQITSDMESLVDFLLARPESKGMPIGTVGFSLGSRGLLLAARRPEIKAVVVYYGTYDVRKEKRVPLPPSAVVPMQVAAAVNAAVLLFHGDADDEIPISSARDMQAALDNAGKKVSLVEYSGAFHRFDRGPSAAMGGEVSRQGYTYRKDERAAADAFSRAVAWLKEHLSPSASRPGR
jgi:dienelactone hydrolase